ncbi:hypothetical protein Mal64_38230 [Pseudobythopirellula maris]|uniref:DUF6036 domain-containing protein n=1 Tax=Pseudobythopirellula maris TaxID=2527991 RepID=A0A5C5ZIB4_9BACT|nr:nucleotidyltransferase [Pseudobythopirellula maris]TWT86283.1 hypothetical protein Mal64_38230 [Pseudobythopirellula maris]
MATIHLPPDFKEFFELLRSEGVEYLLVGGFAVNLHGHVRATGDIDAWVKPSEENAARLASVLRRFGLSGATVDAAALAEPDRVFQIGVPPMRIDLLTGISGLEFADAYSRRLATEIDGVSISVISLDDLRTNKKASGRPQDLADLDRLT